MTLAQTPMVTAASQPGSCIPPRSMSASRRPQASRRTVMAVALIRQSKRHTTSTCSNPHSPTQPLTAAVRSRGFLPWGLPDICPHTSLGMACSAMMGRYRATLNNCGHKGYGTQGNKAVIRDSRLKNGGPMTAASVGKPMVIIGLASSPRQKVA
jgi:hypothetical protein